MPSPFPGMDPFIESQRFDETHSVYLVTLAELLVPLVRPRYTVDVERYVYLTAEDLDKSYKPDVSITETGAEPLRPGNGHSVGTLEPQIPAVPDSDEDDQKFLTIRSRDEKTVVTVIELLSPTNKDAEWGQREYLAKARII